MGLFTKIPIIAEAVGVGSLNTLVQPDFLSPCEQIIPSVRHNTDLGYVKIFRADLAKYKKYSLQWVSLTNSERDAIITFYLDHDASLIPFNWTAPEETSGQLYCFSGEMTSSQQAPNVYSISVDIVQLSPVAFP